MPLLKIHSNTPIQNSHTLLAKASSKLAEILGKPEKFVMLSLEHNPEMIFGGSDAPLLYIELKSIGLPRDKTREISSKLSEFLHQETGVPVDRMYIEFADAERAM